MFSIRSYREADYPTIHSWWKAQNEVAPNPGMMPADSSFILEVDGRPTIAVCLYLTNTKEICYVENFVGNPNCELSSRREGTRLLLAHLKEFATQHGYLRLLCLAHAPKLKSYYQEIGFTPTLDNVMGFSLELRK